MSVRTAPRRAWPSLLLALVGSLVATTAQAAWTPPARVPGSTGFGYPFDLAARSDGRAAVAYGKGGRVMLALRTPSGRWSPARTLSSAGRAATAAEIAFDGRGRLVAVWVEELRRGHGPYLVRTATRSRAGRWSNPQTVGVSGHFRAAGPRVAANARGDAVIVWRGVVGVRGARYGTEAARAVFRPARRPTFGRARTLEARTRGVVTYQQVALGKGGRAYAVWTDVRRRVNRMAVRSGGRWSRPVTISEPPSSLPVVAVGARRRVVVAWHRADADSEGDGTQWGPVEARWRHGDGTMSPIQELSALRVHQPSVAVSPAREVMLAYSSEAEIGDTALHFAVAPPGGAFGGEQVAPNVAAGAPAYAPTQRLAYVADGTAVLVVSDDGIKGAERAPGAAFSDPATISRTGDFPMVAAAGDRAVVVWADGFDVDGEQRLMLSVRRRGGASRAAR